MGIATYQSKMKSVFLFGDKIVIFYKIKIFHITKARKLHGAKWCPCQSEMAFSSINNESVAIQSKRIAQIISILNV